jgi:hypothetical protein
MSVLPPDKQRKAAKRDHDESVAALQEMVDDDLVGPAARTALQLTEEGRDPRVMLLVIESAIEGYFEPRSKKQRNWERKAQERHGNVESS